MIAFKKFYHLNEALPLSMAIEYGRMKHDLKKNQKGGYNKILDEFFEGKDRKIVPLEIPLDELENEASKFKNLNVVLANIEPGYEMSFSDYLQGICQTEVGGKKKQHNIVRVLQKHNLECLVKSYSEDPMKNWKKALNPDKKSVLAYIVFSRHPYDIAGMSTDRHWTSCMNLGVHGPVYKNTKHFDLEPGSNSHFVQSTIEGGGFIAYLIMKDELYPNNKVALKKPISRLLLQPHYSLTPGSKKVAYSICPMYGNQLSSFSKKVTEIIRKLNGELDPFYSIEREFYNEIEISDFKRKNIPKYVSDIFHKYFDINFWIKPSLYTDGDKLKFKFKLTKDVNSSNSKISLISFLINDYSSDFLKFLYKTVSNAGSKGAILGDVFDISVENMDNAVAFFFSLYDGRHELSSSTIKEYLEFLFASFKNWVDEIENNIINNFEIPNFHEIEKANIFLKSIKDEYFFSDMKILLKKHFKVLFELKTKIANKEEISKLRNHANDWISVKYVQAEKLDDYRVSIINVMNAVRRIIKIIPLKSVYSNPEVSNFLDDVFSFYDEFSLFVKEINEISQSAKNKLNEISFPDDEYLSSVYSLYGGLLNLTFKKNLNPAYFLNEYLRDLNLLMQNEILSKWRNKI